MVKEFVTKDSGKRQEYKSGMRRDLQDGKPRFDLLIPADQKYGETLLFRWAMLMERGMAKYGNRNWEKANSQEELDRFKQSAIRHFMQWFSGEEDEDHAAAILYNVNAFEWLRSKIDNEKKNS
jgi:alanine racemase